MTRRTFSNIVSADGPEAAHEASHHLRIGEIQQARLRLPRGARPKAVKLLTAARELPQLFLNGAVTAAMPEMLCTR